MKEFRKWIQQQHDMVNPEETWYAAMSCVLANFVLPNGIISQKLIEEELEVASSET